MEAENGEKMKFLTVKAEELFAFLIHNQANSVSEDKIMEELWCDRDKNKALSKKFYVIYGGLNGYNPYV